MYCPICSDVLVAYDVVLTSLTVVQLLPLELISQKYLRVPEPIALHIRVYLNPTGCLVIFGGLESAIEILMCRQLHEQAYYILLLAEGSW